MLFRKVLDKIKFISDQAAGLKANIRSNVHNHICNKTFKNRHNANTLVKSHNVTADKNQRACIKSIPSISKNWKKKQ